MSYLKEIIEYKQQEIEKEKKSFVRIIHHREEKRDFKKSIKKGSISLIGEIKKASPSVGVIRRHFSPAKIARIYEEENVSAVSVLTDKKFFKGNLSYLNIVRNSCQLPILRKDIIIDEFQIYQSKSSGADAILLIASILEKDKLKSFIKISKKIELDVLCEVHTKDDIKKALSSDAEIIGINNRDLNTFKVDISTTVNLIKFIPRGIIVVSESGIKSKKDIEMLQDVGVDAVLVGETLMRGNIRDNIRKLGF